MAWVAQALVITWKIKIKSQFLLWHTVEKMKNLPSHSVEITGILSCIFGKNFVKVTVLLNQLLKSWFDEIFFWWESTLFWVLTKNSVKLTFSLKSYTVIYKSVNQFDEKIFQWGETFRNYHTVFLSLEKYFVKTAFSGEKFSLTKKIFRQINSWVKYLVNYNCYFHEMFDNNAWENFSFFHTMDCTEIYSYTSIQ